MPDIFKEHLDKDKNIGVDMLRVSFLSDAFPVVKSDVRNDIARLMGHSPGTQLTDRKSVV